MPWISRTGKRRPTSPCRRQTASASPRVSTLSPGSQIDGQTTVRRRGAGGGGGRNDADRRHHARRGQLHSVEDAAGRGRGEPRPAACGRCGGQGWQAGQGGTGTDHRHGGGFAICQPDHTDRRRRARVGWPVTDVRRCRAAGAVDPRPDPRRPILPYHPDDFHAGDDRRRIEPGRCRRDDRRQ